MKLNEIIVEQQLDEIPAGGIGQMAKKVGSRVLNKVPGATAKSKAANLAGKADLGDTANNLHKEFNKYLGTQNKNIKAATGEDLADFLKTKRHTTSATIPSGILQKQQLNDLLMTAAKEAMAGKGGSTTAPSQDTPVDKKTPKEKEKAVDIKKKVPAKLYSQLLKLTPQEKKQLAELL